jgi:hypothetical protein
MFKNRKNIKKLIIGESISFMLSFLVIYFLTERDLIQSLLIAVLSNVILAFMSYRYIMTAFSKDIK